MKFLPKVKIFPRNIIGRDFIVGDIHGCLELLTDKLKEVNFNKNTDRLFAVGDLIDRGPDSIGVLNLLKEKWFFSVKGNHEDMFLSAMTQQYSVYNDFIKNGGNWIEKVKDKKIINPLIDLVYNLPHIIVVGYDDNRFNIVHAELLMYDLTLATDNDIDAWAHDVDNGRYIREVDILWGRTIFSANNLKLDSTKLSKTFCGHTIGKDIRYSNGHIKIDTGAFLKYWKNNEGKLTIVQSTFNDY